MGIFTAKSVPQKTQDELNARASVKAYDQWFATRTTWVHVKSMCDQCDDKVRFLATYLNPSYEDNTAFMGLRPNPVIESIQVKGLGSLGTTKQCTIKMIAFTQEQLDMLSACYGIPSMSVRVQFGWNRSVLGEISPGAAGEYLSDPKAICLINKTREKYPIYDGLQGIVKQWTVNFVKENMWWEFGLELVAASTSILTKPMDDYTSLCYCDRVSIDPSTGESKTESKVTSPFRAEILDSINNISNASNKPGVVVVSLNSQERNELGGEPGGFWNTVASVLPTIGTPKTREAFITFERLQQLINEKTLSQVKKQPLGVKFDSKSFSIVSYKKPVWSTDPHVCLFPGLDFGYTGLNEKAEKCLIKDGDRFGINFDKVLINCIFINKCLDELGQNFLVQDFFQKIFDGITTAAAGLFELSIVDDGSCDDGGGETPNLSVIDLQMYKNEVKAYPIPVYSSKDESGNSITNGGTGAVLRDIKLELKLTDAMMSQALYAGDRKQASGRPCDSSRYNKELTKPRNLALPPRDTIKKPDPTCPKSCDGEAVAERPIAGLYQDMKDEITEAKKETLRAKLIQTYNENSTEDLCKDAMVPYEFSFTVDGIGGFAFSQMVTCDLLPKSNTELYDYQITSVEHNLTYGDWTTTVTTIARPKPAYKK